jgi:DNA-binding IclR family transcriptional regulator
MKSRRNRRHEKVFAALFNLGGEATTQQISKETGMHVNGLAQTLGVLAHVRYLSGKGKESRWKII